MEHWGLKNDRTGSGKAMETLLGPKTAIKTSKIKKNYRKLEKSGILYFPGGGPPIFPGEGCLFFWVDGLGAAILNMNGARFVKIAHLVQQLLNTLPS